MLFGCLVWFSLPCALAQEEVLRGGDRPASKVGERVSVRVEERWSATTRRTLDGEVKPIVLRRVTELSAEFTRELLELHQGSPAAYALTFSSWSWKRGEQTLTDLSGRRLVVRRNPAGLLRVSPPTALVGLSTQARRFLERQAAALTNPDLDRILPRKDLPVSARWEPDVMAVAPLLLEDGKVEQKGSEALGQLERLDAAQAEIKLEAKLRLKRVPGTDAVSKERGLWLVTSTYSWPRARPVTWASLERRSQFKGAGRSKRPDDGRGIRIELDVEGRVKVKVAPAAQ